MCRSYSRPGEAKYENPRWDRCSKIAKMRRFLFRSDRSVVYEERSLNLIHSFDSDERTCDEKVLILTELRNFVNLQNVEKFRILNLSSQCRER